MSTQSRPWIMRLSGAALALALGMGMAGPAAAETATDPYFGFSVQYSAPYAVSDSPYWATQTGVPASSTLTLADPGAATVRDFGVTFLSVGVYPLNSQPTPAQIRRQLRRSVLPGLASSQVSVSRKLRAVRVNGFRGYQVDATSAIGNTRLRSRLTFLAVGARQYQFVAQAPTREWSRRERQFNQMMQTFVPAG